MNQISRRQEALKTALERTFGSSLASLLAVFFEPELRAWNGTASLAKVFWGYGVGVSAVFALLYVRALYDDRLAVQQLLLLSFAVYTVWILMSVWRCAANAPPFWRALARWLTAAWTGNTALLLLFLQLNLVTRYLGS